MPKTRTIVLNIFVPSAVQHLLEQRDAWRDVAVEHTRTIEGLSSHLDAARALCEHRAKEVAMLRAQLASLTPRPSHALARKLAGAPK